MADQHNDKFRTDPAEQPGSAQPPVVPPHPSSEKDTLPPDAASLLTAERPDAHAEDFAAEYADAEFVHPADMADHLENLSLEKQVSTLSRMSKEDAAEALAELDENMAVDVLENLDDDVAAQIIAEMSPDDAADVLDELDEDHRDALLEKLDREDSEELRNLLNFDPDSAGGVMNTELILLEKNFTADEAIAHIRSEMEDKESPYYAYVVDEHQVLVGVLSLRDLMLARPGTVVDNEGHILGVVTYDDIMDIMHEEASADMLGMVGADPEESVDTPWLESVRKRLPWLFVNMINSALSASVVYMFEGSIAQMAVLAVLMPMVANQAGNTGQQALAVMIRQLATDRFDQKKAWMAVVREGKIGIVTGMAMAVVAFFAAWWFTGLPMVGAVMGGALLCDMLLGAVAGGSIPLIFRALGRDPAQASSIFLTTITDGAGFFIFLGLASLFIL